MAESSIFWTTGALGDGAAAYTMAKVIGWINRTFGEGVHLGYANALSCVSAAPNVNVATGAAIVWGFPYENDAPVAVNIPTPIGDTRIDRIVLRADWAAQTVRITRIAGAEGAAAPAITQTYGTTWDLMLCQASITVGGVITVTDERVYVQPLIEVDGAMIKALNVSEGKIVGGAVTAVKLASDAVTTIKILDANVTEAKIGPLAVTAAKLAADAVTTAKILDLNVTAGKLAADAVETAKIKDLNVTAGKLAADAVTTTKILDANVTHAKLATPYGRGAFVWTLGGNQAVATNAGVEYVCPFNLILTGGYIIAKTAPTGADLIMDVHTDAGVGTTVFTTQPNRPTLAAGSAGPTAVVAPDVTALGVGTRIFCAVDQIGSTIPGADVTLILAYKYVMSA